MPLPEILGPVRIGGQQMKQRRTDRFAEYDGEVELRKIDV